MKNKTILKILCVSSCAFVLASTATAQQLDKSMNGQPRHTQAFPMEYKAQVLQVGENIAVTNTTSGKVRGFILRDTYHFLGIPYGANTEGKNRFMPATKPDPWGDKVFPAIWYPNCAPQFIKNGIHSGYFGRFRGFRDHENYDDISENCLGINIWTQGYNDGKKRPVILWIHGGGWSFGNAIEHDDHNGENLSRLGDVVYCSINHRLGPLGYCDLSAFGAKYKNSGNVGAMDLVLALEWIRDNIENFGGDPNNVTLAGHSGGANKISCLMAMPSAKGLFHKAVLMSGAIKYLRPADITKKCGEYIMREAGLQPNEVDKLQEMPWEQFYKIAQSAAAKLCKDEGLEDKGLEANPMKIFEPHVDGDIIVQAPFHPEASPLAKNIPMIVITATGEDSEAYRDPNEANITLDGVRDILKNKYKSRRLSKAWAERADALVDAYSKVFTNLKPFQVMAMIGWHRQRSIAVLDARSKQGGAPVWNAWFNWQAPLHDGLQTAFHPGYPCFWFYNTDLMYTFTGGGPRPRELSKKISLSLINFMKTGNPNCGELPYWPAYTTENGAVMLLQDKSKVVKDPDREARKQLPPYIDN